MTYFLYAMGAILCWRRVMPHTMPSPQSLFAAMYLGCIPLGLSFFLWNRAVTKGNMVIIGFLSYLTPPLSVLLVALIHGEHVSSQVLIGMMITIAASMGGRFCLSKAEPPQKNTNKRLINSMR